MWTAESIDALDNSLQWAKPGSICLGRLTFSGVNVPPTINISKYKQCGALSFHCILHSPRNSSFVVDRNTQYRGGKGQLWRHKCGGESLDHDASRRRSRHNDVQARPRCIECLSHCCSATSPEPRRGPSLNCDCRISSVAHRQTIQLNTNGLVRYGPVFQHIAQAIVHTSSHRLWPHGSNVYMRWFQQSLGWLGHVYTRKIQC
jgi:hypothetical protein